MFTCPDSLISIIQITGHLKDYHQLVRTNSEAKNEELILKNLLFGVPG